MVQSRTPTRNGDDRNATLTTGPILMPEPIAQLVGVDKSFGQTDVLRSVSLDIEPSKTTVIIGPSGCGKSVLLHHLVGLLQPSAGEVYFKGQRIDSLGERAMAPMRRQMGLLFQGGALFDSMTVEENIVFPMQTHNVGSAQQRRDRCAEVLHQVGLGDMQQRLPSELSGGQQKRVALARAIVLKPDIIYYDEPTTGLDPIRAGAVNELILKLSRELGNTAVVVTHDLASARKVGNRIVMLHDGQFCLDTTPEKLDDTIDPIVQGFIQGRAELQYTT